jgi:2-aminoadipate transaminase
VSVATSIPFTRGVPSADLLPAEDLRVSAQEALERDPAGALSYSPGGYLPLREWIAERHAVPASRVLMVNGSLQGLAFLADHFFHDRPGTIVVEDPTYDRTLTTFRHAGARVHAVPLRDDGVDGELFGEALAERPTVAYLIPTYQNPSGVCMSLETRRRVVALAREQEVVLIEDDPYGLLRFEGERLPTLHELDPENVIHSSSFTKTIAPGVRTGYLVLPERLVASFGRISANTYIAPNSLAEATLAAYCRSGRFEPNVERATAELKRRRDAMEQALAAHFPDGSSWTTPSGGYFFWVRLPEGMDAAAALAAATEAGVPYVAGSDFTDAEYGRRCLRLAYSAVPADQIGEGIERLGGVLAASRRAAAV